MFIIDENGTLYGIGNNDNGELGLGHEDHMFNYTPIDIKDSECTPLITNVFCGDESTIVIDNDGNTWVAGDNIFGQLGCKIRKTYIFNKVNMFAGNQNVELKSFYFDTFFTLAISRDGNLWFTGKDMFEFISKNVNHYSLEKIPLPNNLCVDSLVFEYKNLWKNESYLMVLDKECSVWIYKPVCDANNSTLETDKSSKFFPIDLVFDDKIIKPISIRKTKEKLILLDSNGTIWYVNLKNVLTVGTNEKILLSKLEYDIFVKIETFKNNIIALDNNGNLWIHDHNEHNYSCPCNKGGHLKLCKIQYDSFFVDISATNYRFCAQDDKSEFYMIDNGGYEGTLSHMDTEKQKLDKDMTLTKLKRIRVAKMNNSITNFKKQIKSAMYFG